MAARYKRIPLAKNTASCRTTSGRNHQPENGKESDVARSAQLASLAPRSVVWLRRRARNPSALSVRIETRRQQKKITGLPFHASASKTGTSRSRAQLNRFGNFVMPALCGARCEGQRRAERKIRFN